MSIKLTLCFYRGAFMSIGCKSELYCVRVKHDYPVFRFCATVISLIYDVTSRIFLRNAILFIVVITRPILVFLNVSIKT